MKKTAEDRRYEAEMDARTLGEAAAIGADKSRMARASKAAGQLAQEKAAEAAGLKKVAKRGKRKSK